MRNELSDKSMIIVYDIDVIDQEDNIRHTWLLALTPIYNSE